MREILSNDDLKRLLQGASATCAAGLLLGATMQPNLTDDTLKGPQQLVSGGGPRSYGGGAEPGVGGYGANTPDYVIGTDWTRPRPMLSAAYDREPAEDEQAVLTADDQPPTVQIARAEWREPPALPQSYPSSEGGRYYDSDLPAPPPPPGDGDDDPY